MSLQLVSQTTASTGNLQVLRPTRECTVYRLVTSCEHEVFLLPSSVISCSLYREKAFEDRFSASNAVALSLRPGKGETAWCLVAEVRFRGPWVGPQAKSTCGVVVLNERLRMCQPEGAVCLVQLSCARMGRWYEDAREEALAGIPTGASELRRGILYAVNVFVCCERIDYVQATCEEGWSKMLMLIMMW